ncbi:MAG: protoporphyrinogen oxidase [Acidobacteria bacterium]|nr:protoporphyrinogen oxidase [Acidobacteriota bacterium]
MTNSQGKARRIAVVGGGVSGLAAAYFLGRARREGAPVEEFLIEARERLGGVIRTETVEGFLIEGGPDSFLAEKPEAADLCRGLGLGDSLMGSNDDERRTYILLGGRLVPLPDGLMLLVPTRLWPVMTTPLLSLHSKIAMAAEWFTPPRPENADEAADDSVGSFVRRHFGEAMLENIADPLLAGVYGGDSAALSVRSVLPRFWEMEKQYGSLTRGTLEAMRKRRAPSLNSNQSAPQGLPLFMTLKEGLQRIVEQMEVTLEKSRVHLRQKVAALETTSSREAGRYTVRCDGGTVFSADAVVLAMPAYEGAKLLSPVDAEAADLLNAIPYSSSMTVSLGYESAAALQLPPGFGFLAPQKENRRLLACTFVHGKFPHRAPEGKALLRCFLGGSRDPEVLRLDDVEVSALVRRELREILGLSAQPRFCRIYRWPASMPQYVVGHAKRIRKLNARLENHPGLFLAGNAFSGIGISDCVRTGKAAADDVLRFLGR